MATPTNLPASFVSGEILTAANMNLLRGGFRVLQVVTATTTTSATASDATFIDSNLTVTITPQFNTSKIFVLLNQSFYVDTAGAGVAVRLVRGSTTLQTQTDPIYSPTPLVGNVSFLYLDSPATTSATTYKTTFNRKSGTGTTQAQINSNPANITVFEISA
jgi:hypothetical protein